MKLFKMDVIRKDQGREVVAHADSEAAARAYVAGKFTGWTIAAPVEIEGPAYFVVAEFDVDEKRAAEAAPLSASAPLRR